MGGELDARLADDVRAVLERHPGLPRDMILPLVMGEREHQRMVAERDERERQMVRPMTAPDKGLSRQQVAILCWLLARTKEIEAHGNGAAKSDLKHWGVRWRPGHGQDDWTPSDRAVFSRAVLRLAQRGLVLRRNQVSASPRRATHILLTPAGRAAAERLTKTVA